ncbi:glycine cleavage system aminomethyltransferase GcvT [Synoicihabitans lomoniglobus]|uniref:Aminomethyltransferase n=1 Tax=Synoicihabitans lomoniglobus TaxID=2909285 RepID=A0AAF0I4A4_9BACT|nr:glycine cleavage system aminomethyltransferase GcvT [Opitutaceae bacterium LMO-M01]WED66733.1 glycine cleavage system aminomethyltransferase GcvT [Opitutaceae bacterium LMO-M01]
MSELQRTPLHAFHVAHAGRMVDFAGWDMPVQYKSIIEEHKAVRTTAGLFDVSHMGEVDVSGPGALAFLNRLVTNDVSKLYPGRVLYSPMCQPDGGAVDDLLVYHRGEEDYLVVINASNIAKDLAWMRQQAEGFDVTITDRSDDYALIAVQGPRAETILQSLTGAKLGILRYYHFLEGTVAGVQCVISRTGYTGEDGFELYHAAADAPALAEALMTAGEPHGLQLAGLGARDSLRLEAGYPLYGHELEHDLSPIAAGLGWTVKFKKEGGFTGDEALAAEKSDPSRRRVVFFRTGDRRIVRAGADVLNAAGEVIGRVLSGTLSPLLGEAIGSALVPATAADQELSVDIRGTKFTLHLVKPPFVELKKSS